VEELPPEEIRILGVLVEKERTVPDSYPLTRNALTTGCNQTSNRDPVTAYEPGEVAAALRSLREKGLTRVVHSPSNRAEKFRHVLGEALGLEADVLAVLAVLMLRGPQTANELRTRTERYEPGVPDVEAALRVLSTREEPLAVNIGRRAGQREERWMHLLGGPVSADDFAAAPTSTPGPATSSLADRVAALEERMAALEAALGGTEP
jgi:uncharacterized protein YceH (UPF0502 family)